jgi:hypothetical protein
MMLGENACLDAQDGQNAVILAAKGGHDQVLSYLLRCDPQTPCLDADSRTVKLSRTYGQPGYPF